MMAFRGRLFSAVLCLVCAGAFFLLSFRMFATGTNEYSFLLQNLLLAAIPYVLSLFFVRAVRRSSLRSWWAGMIFCLWLFFFPNAPYIVTDFVHLPWGFLRSFRFAYDFALIAVFATAGMLFGVASLFRVHRVFRKSLGAIRSNMIIVGLIVLFGIGIYLGRFLRWNSWDMLINPLRVLDDTFSHFGDPEWFVHAFTLSMFFSFCIGLSYLIFVGAYRIFGRVPQGW